MNVHYSYRFSSSMGMHLSGTACGISSSFFENGGFEFVSPESAMARKPHSYGWWSDDPKHVDCPGCIEKLPALLKSRWEEAEKGAQQTRKYAELLYAQLDFACRKAGVTF